MDTAFTPSHRDGSGSPLVCLHGLADTWRTWELVLPALQARHDVLAVTLAGHAGGPPLSGDVSDSALADAVEAKMDAAGFDTAHVVGNSVGGYLALRLAARGRARSVVALAPPGGWAEDDGSVRETLRYFVMMNDFARQVAPQAEEVAATVQGRRRATELIATNFEHIPPDLVAHMIRGAATCDGLLPLVEYMNEHGYRLDPEKVECPVRVVWGTADRFLPWPSAAIRYRERWLPHADWVVLDDVGHCPQLDVPLQTAQLILSFTAP
jgi:pimeloyl-ACP methyl ester carboxylesterase